MQVLFHPWLREGQEGLPRSGECFAVMGQQMPPSPSVLPTSPGPPTFAKPGGSGGSAAGVGRLIPELNLSAGVGTGSGPPAAALPGAFSMPDNPLGETAAGTADSSRPGGYWQSSGDGEDDADADYGGYYFDQAAAKNMEQAVEAKGLSSLVSWDSRSVAGGGLTSRAGGYRRSGSGGSRDSSPSASLGLPYDSWGGGDSWGGLSSGSEGRGSQELQPLQPKSALRTGGASPGGAEGGGARRKTTSFDPVVAVKEVVYENGEDFADPFLGDSLGAQQAGAAAVAPGSVRLHTGGAGEAAAQAGVAEVVAVRAETHGRWKEMQSDATGIWRFAQLRSERWRCSPPRAFARDRLPG